MVGSLRSVSTIFLHDCGLSLVSSHKFYSIPVRIILSPERLMNRNLLIASCVLEEGQVGRV